MRNKLILIAALFAVQPTWACMQGQANIKGIVTGSEMKTIGGKRRCVVLVEIESSQPDQNCPLTLKEGQEIKILTNLTAKQCPQDEGPVIGEVSNGGGGFYTFTGKLDKYQIK